MSKLTLAAAAAALAFAGSAQVPAQAQVLQERNISLSLAVELAQATVEACAAKNFHVAAAVVDRAGVVRAVLRADRAGVHTADAARRKAYTSASTRTPTSAIADNVEKNPGARQLVAIDGFLVLGGGLPIKAGEETIGAIGVGGAPGGHLDEECAKAGLEKVQAKLK